MSKIIKYLNGLSLEKLEEMKTGYQIMSSINESLSEEGIDLDRRDLESYEKYLVESE
ncbi:MAG: hypothetical protein ACOX4V_01830 [Anaerovoracaceae bacterium]|jgi:hypothetical protein|nr:hypothetical protein [Clostridiales bacterium]